MDSMLTWLKLDCSVWKQQTIQKMHTQWKGEREKGMTDRPAYRKTDRIAVKCNIMEMQRYWRSTSPNRYGSRYKICKKVIKINVPGHDSNVSIFENCKKKLNHSTLILRTVEQVSSATNKPGPHRKCTL